MAVNPHAETYQGKTQFSGPVKAGTRWQDWTDYTRTVGHGTKVTDFPNAGYVVCSQSAAVQQTATGTDTVDIVIPANSMVTAVQLIATVAWTGSSADKKFGPQLTTDAGSGLALTDNTTSVSEISSIGVYNLIPSPHSFNQASRWKNVNFDTSVITPGNDVAILVDSGGGSTGRGILTISYIPGLNL